MPRSFASLFRWPRQKIKNRHKPKRNLIDEEVSIEAETPTAVNKFSYPPAKRFFSKKKTLEPLPHVAKEIDFSLVCYLCGQHVQQTKLAAHVEECLASWQRREESKPMDERVPVPSPPEGMLEPLPVDAQGVATFNAAMRSAWLRSINRRCDCCKKTLGAEAYYKHIKTCHARERTEEETTGEEAAKNARRSRRRLTKFAEIPLSFTPPPDSGPSVSRFGMGMQRDAITDDEERDRRTSGTTEMSVNRRASESLLTSQALSSMKSIFSAVSSRPPKDFAADDSFSEKQTPPQSPLSYRAPSQTRGNDDIVLPKPAKNFKASQDKIDALKRTQVTRPTHLTLSTLLCDQSAKSAFGRTIPNGRRSDSAIGVNASASLSFGKCSGNPPKAVRGYACYLCNRQFTGTALAQHIPRCQEQWKINEVIKKKSDRRPLPSPPPELECPLPTKLHEIEHFNDIMAAVCHGRPLTNCRHCGRKVAESEIERHEQMCAASTAPGPSCACHTSSENPALCSTTSTEIYDSDPGPVQYFCYLCGRQYGSRSLFIHIPRCQKLWREREAAKPKQQRRPLPPPPPQLAGFPDVSLPKYPEAVFQFNNAVYSYWDKVSLYTCQKCSRTFNEESFLKHQRVCIGEAASSVKIPTLNKPPKKRDRKMKRTASTAPFSRKKQSMPIHYVCYLCGGEFSSKNLLPHVHKCEKKWLEEEASRPENQRKELPQRPDELRDESIPSKLLEVAQFNSAMLQHWGKHALTVCKTCGRSVKYSTTAYKGGMPKGVRIEWRPWRHTERSALVHVCEDCRLGNKMVGMFQTCVCRSCILRFPIRNQGLS